MHFFKEFKFFVFIFFFHPAIKTEVIGEFGSRIGVVFHKVSVADVSPIPHFETFYQRIKIPSDNLNLVAKVYFNTYSGYD